MNVVSLISKKRDGGELTEDEIGSLINGYVRGEVPDYQMASWAMAVYLRGMTVAEIRPIRDEIGRRVRGLLEELGVAAAVDAGTG